MPVRSFEREIAPVAEELPGLMAALEDFAAEAGLPPLVAGRLSLLVEEAATNVISHGRSTQPAATLLRIRVAAGAKGTSLTIEDNGRPYDVTRHPVPDTDAPLDQRDPGGLGIHLLRHLSDQLRYHRDRELNRLTCLVKVD
jgi:serine/threonine-protein kinase RsbW